MSPEQNTTEETNGTEKIEQVEKGPETETSNEEVKEKDVADTASEGDGATV